MILTPTGGLIYHLRAQRHQRRLWAPFRSELGAWLRKWKPRETSLLLVGPSGGYCLERTFLDRFPNLSAVDPDPLARLIFQRRFARKVSWSRRDYFSPRHGRFDPAGVKSLLADYPDHALLFCNFLGQLPFLDPKRAQGGSYELWKRRLAELLEGRSWASFHDRLSGELRPSPPSGPLPDQVPDQEVLETMYAERPASGQPIELSDHLTGDLFPGRERQFFDWELRPGTHHLIEAVRS